tara:strand:+ start:378 stop:806 length:429 start_codon:yes stop_codon:yes gene_type:complete
MKNKYYKFILILLIFFNYNITKAEVSYFNDGKKLFDNKKYEKSKFMFEKDIVFNPKNENSYLYLAKIFKEKKEDNLEESHLKTVILLNPKNEEATYLLALLNIKRSNFSKSEELIKNFKVICVKFCSKKKELEEKLDNSLKK